MLVWNKKEKIMAFNFNYISHEIRGYICVAFGVVLLLHTFGILEQWFKTFLVVFAVGFIIHGLIEANVWQRVRELTKKAGDKFEQPKRN